MTDNGYLAFLSLSWGLVIAVPVSVSQATNGVTIFPSESPLCFKPGQLSRLLESLNHLS